MHGDADSYETTTEYFKNDDSEYGVKSKLFKSLFNLILDYKNEKNR